MITRILRLENRGINMRCFILMLFLFATEVSFANEIKFINYPTDRDIEDCARIKGQYVCDTATWQCRCRLNTDILLQQAYDNCQKDFKELSGLCCGQDIQVSTNALDSLIVGVKRIIADLDVTASQREKAYSNLKMLRNKYIGSLFYHRPATLTNDELWDLIKGAAALDRIESERRKAEFRKEMRDFEESRK